MNNERETHGGERNPAICGMGWAEYVALVEHFHSYAAPGVVLGGIMVDLALRHFPKGVLFDAVVETKSCLPDAVQLLTPCTTGNGWLKVLNFGRYALTLYDKKKGEGVRVYIDGHKLPICKNFYDWFFNYVDKKDLPSGVLLEEIRLHGEEVCGVEAVTVDAAFRKRAKKGRVDNCPVCGEPYPLKDGPMCLACRDGSPVRRPGEGFVPDFERPHPDLKIIPIEEAVGKKALNDMTKIVPGQSKGRAFKAGQVIREEDLDLLRSMGKGRIFASDRLPDEKIWAHENEAALVLGAGMSGEGTDYEREPKEGKVQITASRAGLYTVDVDRLKALNLIPDVVCAARRGCEVVKTGDMLAGTRAIPLYLERRFLERAKAVLTKPLFRVLPLRKAKVGIVVTGTEVFKGIIKDKFAPIMTEKVTALGCEVVHTAMAPDVVEEITKGIKACLAAGADLVISTAGMSVDPDDVSKAALLQAGLTDYVFGTPMLPGSMTLVGRIGEAQVLAVPAAALFHTITAADVLLPRLLAGQTFTHDDIAALGHGGLCLNCDPCIYPLCGFGK